ncbi:Exosome-associated family protein [Paramicrosporidium saccamoebae]|uniref:Exosome complex protein n=1 Tax=Paramicrosporidium saccamoebae TaxID=1246581 RepID=A0A2H9TM64_9FUNG|nr:Exosome-associated family protein [Paramicrosporidium saccamoebae]
MLEICEFCVDQFTGKDLSDGLGEGLLRLWTYTKDLRYRQLGIKVLEHVKGRWMQSVGFSTIDGQPVNMDTISELIKSLYLLFGTDDLLGADFWIFSKAGHPYPRSLDGVPNNGVPFPCKPSTPEEMTGLTLISRVVMSSKEKVTQSLEDIASRVDALEKVLQPFLQQPLAETLGELGPLEGAKVQASVAYFHMRLQGGVSGNHLIHKDLDRVKSYLDKVKQAEADFSRKEQVRVNTDAAGRFIRNALGRVPAEGVSMNTDGAQDEKML